MAKLTLDKALDAIANNQLATMKRADVDALLTAEARRIITAALKVLNHTEIAEVLHTSRQTIYNWQNGKAIDPVYAYWTIVNLRAVFPKRVRKPRTKKETK